MPHIQWYAGKCLTAVFPSPLTPKAATRFASFSGLHGIILLPWPISMY